MSIGNFDDLLAANKRYSVSCPRGFDGIAHAGILMITCMDSRLEPLEMIGLRIGEAKIIRTPGGLVAEDAIIGSLLGVYLLNVKRILVVPHTKCAMSSDKEEIVGKIRDKAGVDLDSYNIECAEDQVVRLREDVQTLRNLPEMPADVEIGGFLYDVDTGLLHQEC